MPEAKASTRRPRAAKPKVEIIEETVTRRSQSNLYVLIYKEQDRKFRIMIERDSYNFQSSAVGYVWEPTKLEWNRIYFISYNEMESLKTVQAHGEAYKYQFNADKERIMDRMRKIVF